MDIDEIFMISTICLVSLSFITEFILNKIHYTKMEMKLYLSDINNPLSLYILEYFGKSDILDVCDPQYSVNIIKECVNYTIENKGIDWIGYPTNFSKLDKIIVKHSLHNLIDESVSFIVDIILHNKAILNLSKYHFK